MCIRGVLSRYNLGYILQACERTVAPLDCPGFMKSYPTPQPTNPTTACPDLVLLVDDHEDAIFLLGRLLRKAGINGPVESVYDGDSAIKFLSQRIAEGGNLPLFVALDLNMPKMDGFEVLQWIRKRPELHELVVLVVSSSDEEKDVRRAY